MGTLVNPFVRPVWELEESDLNALEGKAESWFYEYKGGDVLDHPKDVAKAVASFANHHGGWFFIGISADKTSNEPDLSPVEGIDMHELLTERVYQAVADNLSPSPMLHVRDIPLASGKHVVAVQVPESSDSPHIHMPTGSVYVRTGNTSKPADRISSRYDLNLLYQKGQASRAEMKAVLKRRGYGQSLIGSAVRFYKLEPVESSKVPVRLVVVLAPVVSDTTAFLGILERLRKKDLTAPILTHDLEPASDYRYTDWQYGQNGYSMHHFAAFAITTYGHIEAVTLSPSIQEAYPGAEAMINGVCRFGQAAYSDVGYLGDIVTLVSLLMPGEPCVYVARKTDVPALGTPDTKGIQRELLKARSSPDEWHDLPPDLL